MKNSPENASTYPPDIELMKYLLEGAELEYEIVDSQHGSNIEMNREGLIIEFDEDGRFMGFDYE